MELAPRPAPKNTNPVVDISYRHLDPSPALTARIEAEIEKLRRHHPAILSCHVAVEAVHRHGHHYQLHLELKTPRATIAVSHEPGARQVLAVAGVTAPAKRTQVEPAHRDPYVAVRDAFEVAHRRLAAEAGRARSRRHDESPSALLAAKSSPA